MTTTPTTTPTAAFATRLVDSIVTASQGHDADTADALLALIHASIDHLTPTKRDALTAYWDQVRTLIDAATPEQLNNSEPFENTDIAGALLHLRTALGGTLSEHQTDAALRIAQVAITTDDDDFEVYQAYLEEAVFALQHLLPEPVQMAAIQVRSSFRAVRDDAATHARGQNLSRNVLKFQGAEHLLG